MLLEGTYNIATSTSVSRGFQINKDNVVLTGAGSSTILVQTAGSYGTYDMVFVNAAENVTITNLNIDGNRDSITAGFVSGIDVHTRTTVSHVAVTDTDYHGIDISTSDYVVVDSVYISNATNNAIHSTGANNARVINSTLLESATGVTISSDDNSIVSGNHIINNTTGISTVSPDQTIFSNNYISGGSVGIHINNAGNVKVTNNYIATTSGNGINQASGSIGNADTFEGNTVVDVGGSGIAVVGDGSVVIGNIVRNTVLNGISVSSAADYVLVSGNHIYNAGNDSIEISGGIDHVVSNNVIHDTAGSNFAIDDNGTRTILSNNVHRGDGALEIDEGASTIYQQHNRMTVIASSTQYDGGDYTALTITQQGAGDILNLFDQAGGSGAITEVFTVLDGGNVGIGTTSPFAKLSVVGNIYASTTATSTFTHAVRTTCVTYDGTTCLDANAASTFLGLTDTPGSYTTNAIPYESGGALTFNTGFTFDGVYLSAPTFNVATTATSTLFTFGNNPFIYASSSLNNVGFGEFAMATSALITGTSNVAVGTFALSDNTTGDNNTAVGDGALSFNISGNENVAVGSGALLDNISGDANTAIGFQALISATSSNGNTAVGAYALLENTSGTDNTAVGSGALQDNTTGVGNTAVGVSALLVNTTGDSNSAFGRTALQFNTTGSNNIAMGRSALFRNTTGSQNVALGRNALLNNTSATNTIAIGYQAGDGPSNYNAQNNIFIGYQAADAITTGADNNIVIGYDVDLPNNAGSNQLNIGNLIFGTGIDGTEQTLSSGNIGIGSTTPNAKFVIESANNAQPVFKIGSSTASYELFNVDQSGQTTVRAGGLGNSEAVLYLRPQTSNMELVRGVNTSGTFVYNVYLDNGGDPTLNLLTADQQYQIDLEPEREALFENATDVLFNNGGQVGIGTTTPYGMLTIHAQDEGTRPILVIATSTNGAGTTTLFTMGPQGTSTAANGFNLTAGCFAIGGTCLSTTGLWSQNGTSAYYSTGAVGIGTTTPGAQLGVEGTILTGNVIATSTMRIVGGSTRPSSPAEGTLFFDTDTGELLRFASSSWKSDQKTATYIVAASDTPFPERADYQADGTDDNEEINEALNSIPNGGIVLLLEGTYNVSTSSGLAADDVFQFPFDNTTLMGVGSSTVIRLADGLDIGNFIDTDFSLNPSIRNLTLDGNQANQVDPGSGAIRMRFSDNAVIEGVSIHNMDLDGGTGISISDTNNVVIRDVTVNNTDMRRVIFASGDSDKLLIDNVTITNQFYSTVRAVDITVETVTNVRIVNSIMESYYGVLADSPSNYIGGNTFVSDYAGVELLGTASGTIVTNNTIFAESHGILINGADNVVISDNSIENAIYGIRSQADHVLISNNIFKNTGTTAAIDVGGGDSTYVQIIGNYIYNADGSAIQARSSSRYVSIIDNFIKDVNGNAAVIDLEDVDDAIVRGNTIYDDLGTGDAIYIDASSNRAVIADNIYAGGGAVTIDDQASDTIYRQGNRFEITASSTQYAGGDYTALTVTQQGAGDILNLFDQAGGAGASTEVFTVLDGGNVGVGTTSPYAKLSVAGTAVAESFNATNSASIIEINNSTFVQASTTGFNTAVGLDAFTAVTSGVNNVALGPFALNANTDGGQNIAIGVNALRVNTSGSNNTAVGLSTLRLNSTGDWNSVLGRNAMYTNRTGSDNVAIGADALYNNNSATQTVAIGVNAGEGTGDHAAGWNIFIGTNAADEITTGANNNIVIGYDIDLPNNSGSNQLNIGNLIFGTGIDGQDQTLSSGNIGIGSTTPLAKLSVTGDANDHALIVTGTTSTTTLNTNVVIDGGKFEHNTERGVTSITNLDLGPMRFEDNAGWISWVDLPVTSSAATDTPEAFSAMVDGSEILTVYAEADGQGGIKNTRVVVGTSSAAVLASDNIPFGSMIIGDGTLCVDNGGDDCDDAARDTGRVYANNTTVTGIDIAEDYPTIDETLSAGEIVMLDPDTAVHVKRYEASSTNPLLFGVVSTDPGVQLGGFGSEVFATSTKVPVALAGRVPVFVTTEGGPIEIGHRITVSPTKAGVGMRATGTSNTVGIALESYDATSTDVVGDVVVFIDIKEYVPESQFTIQPNGNVGIGTTTPNYHLTVDGDIAGTAFINLSSEVYKKDIDHISATQTRSLHAVAQEIDIATYNYTFEATSSPIDSVVVAVVVLVSVSGVLVPVSGVGAGVSSPPEVTGSPVVSVLTSPL